MRYTGDALSLLLVLLLLIMYPQHRALSLHTIWNLFVNLSMQ
jgi:hypothetical protein